MYHIAHIIGGVALLFALSGLSMEYRGNRFDDKDVIVVVVSAALAAWGLLY